MVVDAVVVAAPAALHHAVALACLVARKPVLCEAPLALDGAQGRELVLAAERAGVANGYVRPRPFLYGGREVRELCDAVWNAKRVEATAMTGAET